MHIQGTEKHHVTVWVIKQQVALKKKMFLKALFIYVQSDYDY